MSERSYRMQKAEVEVLSKNTLNRYLLVCDNSTSKILKAGPALAKEALLSKISIPKSRG